MRRAAVTLVALAALASCGKTPIERGAELFRPAAEKLGQAQAAELKAKYDKAYKQYLQETGSKDEAELGRKFSVEHLKHYAAALAVSEAQEADFKAGKFRDVERRMRFNEVATRYAEGSTSMVGRLILTKSQAGPEWTSGLQLELSIRIMESDLGLASK
jgi:hypothetical protein